MKNKELKRSFNQRRRKRSLKKQFEQCAEVVYKELFFFKDRARFTR